MRLRRKIAELIFNHERDEYHRVSKEPAKFYENLSFSRKVHYLCEADKFIAVSKELKNERNKIQQ